MTGTGNRVGDPVAVRIRQHAAGEIGKLVQVVVPVAGPVCVIELVEAVVDLVCAIKGVAVPVVAVSQPIHVGEAGSCECA